MVLRPYAICWSSLLSVRLAVPGSFSGGTACFPAPSPLVARLRSRVKGGMVAVAEQRTVDEPGPLTSFCDHARRIGIASAMRNDPNPLVVQASDRKKYSGPETRVQKPKPSKIHVYHHCISILGIRNSSTTYTLFIPVCIVASIVPYNGT